MMMMMMVMMMVMMKLHQNERGQQRENPLIKHVKPFHLVSALRVGDGGHLIPVFRAPHSAAETSESRYSGETSEIPENLYKKKRSIFQKVTSATSGDLRYPQVTPHLAGVLPPMLNPAQSMFSVILPLNDWLLLHVSEETMGSLTVRSVEGICPPLGLV
ncbi:hypothetical protein F7725_001444 [Dissostichus mawsoni]|uniref:Uncharacterized protein n=1 Tax=Dissostichus mawsoni TaxID=36200 RepID=A0A7J5ZJQ9_DISMA|nr:hypothetical protein F7725_001444 [Dissostichus mawsoni]